MEKISQLERLARLLLKEFYQIEPEEGVLLGHSGHPKAIHCVDVAVRIQCEFPEWEGVLEDDDE